MALSTKTTSRAVTETNASFKEIFKGTRNYWRFRTNVDVNIIDHTEVKVIEVICFNADVMQECRHYLSSVAVMALVDLGKLENLIAAKKEEYNRRKKAFVDKEVKDEVLGNLISEVLLNRISINSFDKEKSLFEVSFVAPGTDDVTAELMVPKPDALVPFPIDRAQKNSSSSEIANTIAALKADSIMLSRAMQKADRISKLTSIGSQGFKDLMKQARATRSKMSLESYSLPRQRWIMAIRRVILRNAVDAVKLRVEKFEENERQLAEVKATARQQNDALLSAIQTAEERALTGVNQLSPRLAPLEKQASNGTGVSSIGKSTKSNAVELPKLAPVSARARRQTADTATSTKASARNKESSSTPHLTPLPNLSQLGDNVAAAAAAAAGALSSLTHAVEGALGKGKQAQSGEETAQVGAKSARSGKSRRRSTLETRAPNAEGQGSSSGKSKSGRKNSARFKEVEDAVAAAAAEGEELTDADCVEPSSVPPGGGAAGAGSVSTRLRRVTEAVTDVDLDNVATAEAAATTAVAGDGDIVKAEPSSLESTVDTLSSTVDSIALGDAAAAAASDAVAVTA